MYDASLSLQDIVYFCLSPCGWCKTREGDGAAVWKYLSLLKEFQAAAVSMAHKRHLHQAQGWISVFVSPQILDRYSDYIPIKFRW